MNDCPRRYTQKKAAYRSASHIKNPRFGGVLLFQRVEDGGWVFFQRLKEYGGGYWLGRTYPDCFWLEFERPVSLSEGLTYLMTRTTVARQVIEFYDHLQLE
ncbi:hypothetical protein ACP26E_02665 [Franconibacter pulveris 601]|uniref:hypothetical protein n=1 Tax=Franconibacter pulveris TaxID=435910 RepID=UPI001F3E57D3|nr:hypothetical protein [Franconibacter pulveris]